MENSRLSDDHKAGPYVLFLGKYPACPAVGGRLTIIAVAPKLAVIIAWFAFGLE
jgi:hypothetical protein